VGGWDSLQLLDIGLRAVGGAVGKRDELHAAMTRATFKSPRGPFRLSAANNPIHDFYLRELKGGKNVLVKTVVTDFADPGTGCRLAS
jgi:branched-chain amino acid transport system substrate-binding protein